MSAPTIEMQAELSLPRDRFADAVVEAAYVVPDDRREELSPDQIAVLGGAICRVVQNRQGIGDTKWAAYPLAKYCFMLAGGAEPEIIPPKEELLESWAQLVIGGLGQIPPRYLKERIPKVYEEAGLPYPEILPQPGPPRGPHKRIKKAPPLSDAGTQAAFGVGRVELGLAILDGPERGWTTQALCVRRGNPEEFYAVREPDQRRAVTRHCAQCIVRLSCLTHALIDGDRHGVQGATEADRAIFRRAVRKDGHVDPAAWAEEVAGEKWRSLQQEAADAAAQDSSAGDAR